MSTLAMIGALFGAILGGRIPEIQAVHYEGKTRLGTILVAVHTESSAAAARAREVLRSVAASDVTASAEAAVPINARA